MGSNEILFAGEVILLLGLGVVGFFLYTTRAHYNKLTKGQNGGTLQSVLEHLIVENRAAQNDIEKVKKELENLKHESMSHLQKVSVMRFNPFGDTGGDQSFILTLLDNKSSGISITSLHSRGVTRWYAKNIKEGKGVDHELSKEEVSAIKNLQEKN